MLHAVLRVFDVFDRAQRARETLLAEGFEAGDISVNVANDEAGPVEGNFTVGNNPTESPQHTYERSYARTKQVSQCIITVAAADAGRAARADAILAQFGGRAVADPRRS